MFSQDLVSFLRDGLPVQLAEIGAAMDLLIETINEAGEAISTKGNEFLAKKEFEHAIKLIEKAKVLHDLSERLLDYSDALELEETTLVSEDEALDDIEKTYPNYSDYGVDNAVAHTLHESFVHKRPHAFELGGRKVYVTEWKKMLVETCNILSDFNAGIISGFPSNPKFSGRKLAYFTTGNPGQFRSPRKINGLELYVETNFSANFIRNLIIKMLNQYKIPLSEFKVYLRADYTALHREIVKDGAGGEEPNNRVEDAQDRQKDMIDITSDCVRYIGSCLNMPLSKLSKAIYRSHDKKTTVVCLTSKGRNTGGRREYWFGLRINHKEALGGGGNPYLALGCGSANKILLIPYFNFEKWLDDMSISGNTKTSHWNINVIERQGDYTLRLKAGCPNVDLTKYKLRQGNK